MAVPIVEARVVPNLLTAILSVFEQINTVGSVGGSNVSAEVGGTGAEKAMFPSSE